LFSLNDNFIAFLYSSSSSSLKLSNDEFESERIWEELIIVEIRSEVIKLELEDDILYEEL
jgi:hypothetical protein